MEKHSNRKSRERAVANHEKFPASGAVEAVGDKGARTNPIGSLLRVFQAGGKRKTARTPNTRREMLALRPIRNPNVQWDEEDGQIVLTVKRINTWKTRLILIFTQVPESRRIELDPLGTHVWKMLDGSTSFEKIARSLAKEFKLLPREAEMSLQQFFKELGRRGYVGFMK